MRFSASADPRENAARESPLRDTRKRLHHSAEIREGPKKRARPSSEAGAAQPEFVRDTGYGEEEDAETDESSEFEDDTELQFFVPDHGIVYKDVFNISCSLPVSDLSSFSPGDPLPERIPHFLAQHILRAEATRTFPNTLDMVWFRDSCFSSWVSSIIEMEDATRRSEGSIKFSEHEVGLMRAAGQIDIVVPPFLADGHNSLFVVEGLKKFLEHTRAIIGSGRDVEETLPDAEPPESREVFSYCLKRRGSLRSYSICVHHVGGGVEVHEKYRSAFRSWIEEFCMIVLGEDEACGITEAALLAAIEGKFEFNILDVSRADLFPAAGGLLSIGYLMTFLEFYVGRTSGENMIGTIPEEYSKPSRLMKFANIALENHQRVAKIDGYRPFEMWSTSVLDVVRKEVRLQGRFSTEVSIIAASIPVASEFLYVQWINTLRRTGQSMRGWRIGTTLMLTRGNGLLRK